MRKSNFSYAGSKVFICGIRAKELEHGHGLAPAFLYEQRMAWREQDVAIWEKAVADNPDNEFIKAELTKARSKLTKNRNHLQRARDWERRRDEREAREEAEMKALRAAR